MNIKYIKGNGNYGSYNVESIDDVLYLGRFYCDCKLDKNDKIITIKRRIVIVKQKHWYQNIKILFHEFLHYLVDCKYPTKVGHPLHKYVDKYFTIKA